MKNKDLIENYQHQLAELQNQFWFNNLDMKEYCVRYDAIKKRINELENETNRQKLAIQATFRLIKSLILWQKVDPAKQNIITELIK